MVAGSVTVPVNVGLAENTRLPEPVSLVAPVKSRFQDDAAEALSPSVAEK